MDKITPAMLEDLVKLVEDAGRLVMTASRAATQKEDGTDLTAADMLSHHFLVAGIERLAGKDARILSEEDIPASDITQGTAFIIDPLDGTSNFSAGRRNFSVVLAVLEDGVPVYGIAVAPAYGITACGGTLVQGAELRLHVKDSEQTGYREIRKLSPIAHQGHVTIVPDRFLKTDKKEERAIIDRAMDMFQARAGRMSFKGSSAVLGSMLPVLNKHIRCRLYEAIRSNQQPGDWDLAAWDAILQGAGGIMTSLDGHALVYGDASRGFRHQGFISWRQKSEAAAYCAAPTPGKPPTPVL